MCMERLEELTNQIVALGDVESRVNSNRVDFELQSGISYAVNLLTNNDVHVSNMFIGAGTKFPYHLHDDAIEYLVIFNGELVFIEKDNITRVGKGDIITVNKNIAHRLIAVSDTNLIVITVPATKESKSIFGDGGS